MTLPPQPQPVHEPTPQRAPIFALIIIALFALLLIGWMKMDSTAPVTPAVIEQVPPATSDLVPAPTTPPAP